MEENAGHLRRKLDVFHYRCVLGINSGKTQNVGERGVHFDKVNGHLARMSDQITPKRILFSWLKKRRPRCGTKRRWRDIVRKDLTAANINAGIFMTAENGINHVLRELLIKQRDL